MDPSAGLNSMYHRGLCWYVGVERKWTTFRRRHFQTYFIQRKCLNLDDISLKFVSKGPINNISALVQIMAWRRSGDKPLSEPMMASLLTHICVTRLQWVNNVVYLRLGHRWVITSHRFMWVRLFIHVLKLMFLANLCLQNRRPGDAASLWWEFLHLKECLCIEMELKFL